MEKIKLLWVTNTPMPDLLEGLGRKKIHGGSWLIEPLRLLASDDNYDVSVAAPWGEKNKKHLKIKNVDYYLIPCTWFSRMRWPNKEYSMMCKQLVKEISPDIIHIHGSEFPIGIPFTEISDAIKVLTLQGMISVINDRYFYAGIKIPSWIGCLMPWNILEYFPMKLQHARNIWRAKSEIIQIKNVDALSGITKWDYVFSRLISDKNNYYYIDCAIRREFSQEKWDIRNIERHTILIGNMTVPLKGCHTLFKAFSILKKRYPDARIKIIGTDSFSKKYKFGYSRYLYKTAKKLNVLESIDTLGPQDTNGVVKTMLSCHTFVLSSSIENGPNIMMESEFVGLPCVCSYVGGAMQFAKPEEEALFYRFDEPEMMAYQISRIWDDDDLAISLSEKSRARAKLFDTYEEVYKKYGDMYKDLLKKNKYTVL